MGEWTQAYYDSKDSEPDYPVDFHEYGKTQQSIRDKLKSDFIHMWESDPAIKADVRFIMSDLGFLYRQNCNVFYSLCSKKFDGISALFCPKKKELTISGIALTSKAQYRTFVLPMSEESRYEFMRCITGPEYYI